MESSEIIFIITNALLCAGCLVTYMLLFRDNLRTSRPAACVLFALGSAGCLTVSIITSMNSNLQIPGLDMIADVFFLLPIVFLVKKNWMNCMIQFFLYMPLYSSLGIILFAVFSLIYSKVKGTSGWYIKTEDGIGMFVVSNLIYVAGMILAYLIVRCFKETILGLQGGRRIAIFAITAGAYVACNIAQSLFVNIAEYRNNPSGVGLIIDYIDIGVYIVAIGWVLIIHVKNKRRKKKSVTAEFAGGPNMYNQAEELRSEIRELNHEINNLKDVKKK